MDATGKQIRSFPDFSLVKVLKICRNCKVVDLHTQQVVLQSFFFKCSKMHMRCLDEAHSILIPSSLFN